jgi:uncharacterized membrane protein
MNKIIFVAFDNEKKAYEGNRALHEMHQDGTITLYDDAVVVKEASGKVAVRESPDAGPVGTFGGMLTGGLIGLLGGPLGAAVGMGTGTLVGTAFDLAREGLGMDFVVDAGGRLEPGKAAVIAEIDELWQAPLDSRMEALGGMVARWTETQVEDAYLEREIETAQRELASLEAEKLAAVHGAEIKKSQQKAAKLQKKIDMARQVVDVKEDKLNAKIRAVKEEGNKKVAALEAQKATATEESEILLERRLADVRSSYEGRIKRLQEVLDRRKAARATATA